MVFWSLRLFVAGRRIRFSMCNRYVPRRIDLKRLAMTGLNDPLFEEFTDRPKLETSFPDGASASVPPPDRDEVRPTDCDWVVRVVGDEMRIDLLRWGLIPAFELDPKIGYSTFNAKAETVAKIRAFRKAWQNRQRCLVPVEAFFEWKGDKPPKQKFRIGVKGQPYFCLAGLWDKWSRAGETIETFTIITTTANELVAEIHDKKRMPVIIDPKDYDRWLHDPGDVSDLLKAYPSAQMQAVPVINPRAASKTEEPKLF